MASAFVDELIQLDCIKFLHIHGSPNHEDSDSLHVSPACIDLPIKQREPKSLFVVVNTRAGRLYSGGIFEVKLKQGGAEDVGNAPLKLSPVAKIPGTLTIQSARIFSHSKLYLLLEEGWIFDDGPIDPLVGCIFNIKTGKVEPFVPPIGSKPFGTVVSAYGRLYHLATPGNWPQIPNPSFECYDPVKNTWEELPSFPFFREDWFGIRRFGYTIGFAVCYGFIVFSMADCTGKFRVYAFYVRRSEWYRVKADEPFEGRAVVIGNTIYALRDSYRGLSQVLEFYFTIDEGDGGSIVCSLSTPSALHGLEIAPPPHPFHDSVSQYLVHLGNQDLCYVQTGTSFDSFYQQLCVTTFQIVGEEGSRRIKTLHSAVYALDMKEFDAIQINFCCTPEHDDFEPEGKQPNQEKETKCKESALDENLMVDKACSELLGCQLTKEKVKGKNRDKGNRRRKNRT